MPADSQGCHPATVQARRQRPVAVLLLRDRNRRAIESTLKERRAPRCDRSPRSRAVARSLAQVAHRPNLDATKNGSRLLGSNGNCLIEVDGLNQEISSDLFV